VKRSLDVQGRQMSIKKQGIRSEAALGKVRIVGGILRGSKLAVPNLPGLRPSSDRVRETLFNWLSPVIEGSRCLDLFAGTGSLGIEALSRGASSVTFVENQALLAEQLIANLQRLKIEQAKVNRSDALMTLKGPSRPYDIVFIDPPFDHDMWDEVIYLLQEGCWLAQNAYIYLETPKVKKISVPKQWLCWRQGFAGLVQYALYRHGL
jgi:16S rRNA (guanine966-N2)-methyltransferase